MNYLSELLANERRRQMEKDAESWRHANAAMKAARRMREALRNRKAAKDEPANDTRR